MVRNPFARLLPSVMALLSIVPSLAQQDTCRMAPGARHAYCGLPLDLSNFQGYFQCNDAVKVGRPVTIAEAQKLVTMFPHVRGSGVGHSWSTGQFCSGNDSSAINIVMTELQSVLSFIENPVDPAKWQNQTVPADFPIHVDEENQTVTVAAGIPQRELLDYLSSYTHWKQPSGWTLPAFSWFIDQTIGGAVSTGTHGSSMRWGSLSSQVRGLKVILANGTLLELKSPEENPHLWRALGVMVGRLGVITELTMRIIPQKAVKRNLDSVNYKQFAAQIQATQRDYVAAKNANNYTAVQDALFQLDNTQALWHYGLNLVWRVDYQFLGHEPQNVLPNIDSVSPNVQAMEGPSMNDVFSQQPHGRVPPNLAMTRNPAYWANFFMLTTQGYVTSGTYETSKAYLTMSEFGTATTSTLAPYKQLEVAVPMEVAGDCLVALDSVMYGPSQAWKGFRTPALVRFVDGEDFYLSPTNGGPRMYVNIEDYVSLSTGQPNKEFDQVVRFFMDKCNARLHWGKYGFSEYDPGFDGAKTYPDTWCDFGCAVQQLDPSNKFVGASNVWRWNATRNGTATDFASCCTPEGFNKAQCTCALSPIQ